MTLGGMNTYQWKSDGFFFMCFKAPVVSVMATCSFLRIMENLSWFMLLPIMGIIRDSERANKANNEKSDM